MPRPTRDGDLPKYAIPEIERRWLADLDAVGPLEGRAHWVIEDLYLEGTRLRLRAMIDPEGLTVFKLCKKYGRSGPCSEPITNLYLDAGEHALLRALPGVRSRKRRYRVSGGSLDVYERPHAGLAIFEREFPDEEAAGAYEPPRFARREVTGEPGYAGAILAEPASR